MVARAACAASSFAPVLADQPRAASAQSGPAATRTPAGGGGKGMLPSRPPGVAAWANG